MSASQESSLQPRRCAKPSKRCEGVSLEFIFASWAVGVSFVGGVLAGYVPIVHEWA